jgi:hypothetical protein
VTLADVVLWHELVELRIPLSLTGYATEPDVGDGCVSPVDTYGRSDDATDHLQRALHDAE